MPSAMETTAAAAKPGDFESRRSAYFRSCRNVAILSLRSRQGDCSRNPAGTNLRSHIKVMAVLGRKQAPEELRCSFCHKSEKTVDKLISSPSDYPRAYICDECIAVCGSILDDDRRTREPDVQPVEAEGRFVYHPLALEFLTAAERWAVRDLTGLEASDELNHLRALAARMLAE